VLLSLCRLANHIVDIYLRKQKYFLSVNYTIRD
jgi:hypothetical protein